jgi:hypothetical protein
MTNDNVLNVIVYTVPAVCFSVCPYACATINELLDSC